tara:strand:- start:7937 stop:8194 length:258 start_codon:yes stop_codon:yes gene_type:complete
MSIQVGVSGVRVAKIKLGSSGVQVAKVVVGTPVKRVTSGAFNVSSLGGVDTTGAVTGSVLVYDEEVGKFVAKLDLTDTNLNGGQY